MTMYKVTEREKKRERDIDGNGHNDHQLIRIRNG